MSSSDKPPSIEEYNQNIKSLYDSLDYKIKESLAVESIGTINGLLANGIYDSQGKDALVFNLRRAYVYYSNVHGRLSNELIFSFTGAYMNLLSKIDLLKSRFKLDELEFLRRCSKVVSGSLSREYAFFNKDFKKLVNHLSDLIAKSSFDNNCTVEVFMTTNELIAKKSFSRESVPPLLAALNYFTKKHSSFDVESIRLLTHSYSDFLPFAKNSFTKHDLSSLLSYANDIKTIHDSSINEPFNLYF
ncbi:MAG TPA: hypothetical protein VI790_02090 [Candidatus Nanoarchaeia archaeon]|nr:hypothetical protein [Candidatus Nanoarchaeia archaeon]